MKKLNKTVLKKFTFITLFPDLIANYVNESIIAKALKKQLIEVNIIDLRKYATNNYKQVDDYQYGGKSGMVLMVEPVHKCLVDNDLLNDHIIMLSPRGQTWNQSLAVQESQLKRNVVYLCGHYEGFDERVNVFVNEYVSVGDYVLTSGELSSLTIFDSVVRLIDGVINQESLESESFNDHLLDHPVYTKPQVYLNQAVPEILLSGHHANIEKYRLQERIRLTKKYRPDLYAKYLASKK